MKKHTNREIPFNYTSAGDDQIISLLFGPEMFTDMESLSPRRITGRSARLLFRFMGDMFIIQRNPFLFQEMVDHPNHRARFLKNVEKDLSTIESKSDDEQVMRVIRHCREHLKNLSRRISRSSSDRRRLLKALAPIVGRENIYFDPFNLVSHTTDATDWRLYPPLAVVRPSRTSQVSPLIREIKRLGLSIIPRGGGTGLTGGSVPLTRSCVMINTEKLNRIGGVTHETAQSGKIVHCLSVEAGVITGDAMKEARSRNLIFAADPTSSWASTIGGNIAENAGGKTAVLFGTTLDNILYYHMVMPDGETVEVRRKDHPMRKIAQDDLVIFEVRNPDGELIREIHLKGEEIRKPGLGKDVTNKALGGLPGVQKEGCDGIITDAGFILYPEYPLKRTFVLEFFGSDMREAGQVISIISKNFNQRPTDAALIALEHFDEEYIKAIDYKAKAAGEGRLKAVLLIDMVGENQAQIEAGEKTLKTILEDFDQTRLTAAAGKEEAERFWRDRKKLGAIARRTNAFKLNEDIVLPIDSLAEFAGFVDSENLEELRYNQLSLIDNLFAYLETAEPLEDPDWLVAKVSHAGQMAEKARIKTRNATRSSLERGTYAEEFFTGLMELLRGYSRVTENLQKIRKETLDRLIVIATHMHAGDGNVHINIPVLSNDREMMARASNEADRIMEKTVALDGVVSGEHGIGITKFKHLSQDRIEKLSAYRDEVDPQGVMNPKKLRDRDIINSIYTPSFNLLELEARILRYGSLENLLSMISKCVRCGKCKALCPTFYPQKNLFFHPRNKNLAVASLIEALLYVTQRTQSTRFRAIHHLEEIADHCTICHKCLTQCPVAIDSGEVSVMEREILSERKVKHRALPTRLTLQYLATRSPLKNKGMRPLLVGLGGTLQRRASDAVKAISRFKTLPDRPLFQMLESRVPRIPAATMRAIFPKCGPNQAILANPPEEARHTVFYFPGCGSERLFSQIGKATVFLLLSQGVRVILPPPYLCCGFPARVNARKDQFGRLTLKNTIIFSQIREMFDDLDFNACIISCGTCRESLENMDAGAIFDCRVTDISRFILELMPDLDLNTEKKILYHAPCHDSLDGEAASLLNRAGLKLTVTAHCCSEAGTLALSRPDISSAMLERKTNALDRAAPSETRPATILTNCPSCLQGLGRQEDLGIRPRHLAVALAEKTGGENWEEKLQQWLTGCEVITF